MLNWQVPNLDKKDKLLTQIWYGKIEGFENLFLKIDRLGQTHTNGPRRGIKKINSYLFGKKLIIIIYSKEIWIFCKETQSCAN